MSTEAEEKRLLAAILPVQLGKLRANAHKIHWRAELLDDGPTSAPENRFQRVRRLLKLAQAEMKELEDELAALDLRAAPLSNDFVESTSLAKAGKIRGEVADCMNVLAMIADVVAQDSPDVR